jgi:hypothetical protein
LTRALWCNQQRLFAFQLCLTDASGFETEPPQFGTRNFRKTTQPADSSGHDGLAWRLLPVS